MHQHTCALDGVYVEAEEGEALRFVAAAPPSRADLYALAERVALQAMTWLRKRGYAKNDDHASNDTPERTFAEVLAHVATQRGTVEKSRTTPARATALPSRRLPPETRPPRAMASTCTPASPSPPTMSERQHVRADELGACAVERGRRERWSGKVPTASAGVGAQVAFRSQAVDEAEMDRRDPLCRGRVLEPVREVQLVGL